jgi:hypothetical protein
MLNRTGKAAYGRTAGGRGCVYKDSESRDDCDRGGEFHSDLGICNKRGLSRVLYISPEKRGDVHEMKLASITQRLGLVYLLRVMYQFCDSRGMRHTYHPALGARRQVVRELGFHHCKGHHDQNHAHVTQTIQICRPCDIYGPCALQKSIKSTSGHQNNSYLP